MTTYRNFKFYLFLTLTSFLLLFSACERDIEELEEATFPSNAEVFIDGFNGIDYAAFAGSKLTAFQVDNDIVYRGDASMRFEVPEEGDESGSFAGGFFFDLGGRDLSGFDALTFWARASQPADINELGFGNLDDGSTVTTLSGVSVNTNWKKIIIPIPDPSKLTEERILFYYSEGPENGKGYTFWIDEVRYESLGTLAQPRPAILDGGEQTVTAETGDEIAITGLRMTYNAASGADITTSAGPGYFEFSSSDPSVATVSNEGVAMVLDAGQTVVTATLGGIEAAGALTIEGTGDPLLPPVAAPAPTENPDSVISMFSNVYDDVPVDTWDSGWEFSTADVSDVQIGDDDVKRYKNLNFVGVLTENNPIDATEMTHFHIDIWTPDETAPPATFKILLVDFGPDGAFDGGDDSSHELTFTSPTLKTGEWVSLDIPLSEFVGLTNRANIAQLVLSGELPNVFVDNVYYYIGGITPKAEPVVGAPAPTQNAADVVSLFSDAYTDVPVDTWRTDWSSGTLEDITVDGNPTKKYSNLDFVGVETVANPVDATDMTHFHIDVWSPDFTLFGVKLVDFGADGAFGGGDDVEFQVNIDALAQEEWVSLDIPLSDFTDLTTRGHIGQLILVGQPTGTTTVYVDNVYFYGDGGGTPTDPTMAAPNPMEDPANVISMFSDAYTDVPVDTWLTPWSSAMLEDVLVDGNATKKYTELDFAGVETVTNTIDASNMTNFRMDVWSGDFTFLGIKLVDFGADGAFGGGDDVEHQVNFDMPAQGQWVSLDIPLTDFTGLTTQGHIGQLVIAGQPTGATTVYVDNVYFYGDGGGGDPTEPTMAAPTPMEDEADVISLFSDAYTDVSVDTWLTPWSSAMLEDVLVDGNATKKYTELDFAGVETVSNTVDATNMTNFRIDLWSADYTLFGIKLVDFGADGAFGGGDDVEFQINFDMPMQGEWVSLDIPLSDFTGLTTQAHIGQYVLVGQPTGTTTLYVDNVYFYGDGGGTPTEPATAAPTPTDDAADVISLFSDAYTDVTVDTWLTPWSSAMLEDVLVDGNATKKYTNLDFAGVETVANTVDASEMTHFRMDVWSADYTFFGIKLVDFGADGAFGGGDDVEHQINFEMPAQAQWVSFDIPLSEFAGLTTQSNIAQYIIVGQPTGMTTVYVDNVYFRK